MKMQLNDTSIFPLQYVDDAVIFAPVKYDIEYMAQNIKEREKLGLTMYTAKLKYKGTGNNVDELKIFDKDKEKIHWK